jgi:hypothetical protein
VRPGDIADIGCMRLSVAKPSFAARFLSLRQAKPSDVSLMVGTGEQPELRSPDYPAAQFAMSDFQNGDLS